MSIGREHLTKPRGRSRHRSKAATADEAEKMMACAFAGISYGELQVRRAVEQARALAEVRRRHTVTAVNAARFLSDYAAAGGPLWGPTTTRPAKPARRPQGGRSW